MAKVINYGFGVDYLPNWGLNEALREIYQNFLDYGSFEENIFFEDGVAVVTIQNDWKPESLDFLRIGNSQKRNSEAIGKHGEGLKMAFMILQREGFGSCIQAGKYVVFPSVYIDDEIGECFCLKYTTELAITSGFKIKLFCPENVFKSFRDGIIQPEDIIFKNRIYGDIVNKEKGNIYSGGLFVTKLPKMTYAYNIKPDHLPLDRDRSVPKHFDVSYAASKINSLYEKFTTEDLDNTDVQFVESIPEEIKQEFRPTIIGDKIEFLYRDKETDEEVIVKNHHVSDLLKKDSFFASAIKKIKMFVAEKLGLNDMLKNFIEKYKYQMSHEAKQDFELILERAGITSEEKITAEIPF